MSGDAGSINLNEECVISTAIASNGEAASVTVTDPDGQPVDISGGTFVPDRLGDYTFTYVLEDTGMTRVIVRSCVDPQNPPVTIGLIGADQAASGHRFNVVIHMNRDDQAVVGDSAFTLTYDPAVVSYRGADLKLSTVSVTDDGAGKLAITYTGDVTTDDFMKYDTTRLVKLVFESEAAETDRDAVFTVENIQIDTETNRIIAEPKTVKVVGQSSLDRNGDGVIGAGDIALAETMAQKQLIAAEAAIYPYKHAVVITIDGGGICFRPDRMYYASSASVSPTLTDDPSILALRHNPYAMSLFNEYCATSYSALSETPTSSTPNYTSILHGKEYATARPSHQIVNSKAAIYYYPDFVEEVPLYPSVFKALGKTFPNRGTAATAEWKEIVSGVIEPDAPVYTFSYGYSAGSMQDVADYILSEDWNNTAMIYLQSDEMDHVGHASGYFTPKFYSSLTQYDGYLKAVMDALEAVGSKDDTLLVINTDHGGNKKSHSGPTDPEYDVLIALGGQTIHSGKLLEGGENHDIPAIVLTALRSEIPESMDGTADLLQQASLNQTELIAKNRNVETVTATTGTDCNALLLTLSNVQEGNTITVLDTVVDLKGQELLALETEGAVLRQETADGKLYLTISYAQTPETLALLNLSGETCEAQVEEFMLGTASGKEIYGDLALTTGELLNQSPYAQAKAVDAMIEAIDPADRATVLAARAAYDALSDEAKAHVTKLAELKAAESTWDPEKEIASLVLTGPDVVHAYDGAVTYTLCAENMHALATVHLEIDVPTAYLAEPVAQAADGWYIVVQVLKGDKLTVVAANNDGANGDGDILTLTVKPVKKAGEAVLAVSFAELGAYLGEEETFVSTDLTGAALTVQVRYNVCDVNHDGVVNLLDMTRAQRWYDTDNADADVNSSGDVDIIDLILILNNYNEKFAE